MILVDTSAWVEFLRATESPVHQTLRYAIGDGAPLATTDVVAMELLAGARDDRQVRALRRLLAGLEHLPVEGPTDFEAAAAIYRQCRSQGRTIRAQIDCLIAAVAIRQGVPVLHADCDFDTIASLTGLGVVSTV